MLFHRPGFKHLNQLSFTLVVSDSLVWFIIMNTTLMILMIFSCAQLYANKPQFMAVGSHEWK